jgi:signal transduction histidine kinase
MTQDRGDAKAERPIQSVVMIETAGMLQARLCLIERIRRVEHDLARDEQAKAAATLLRGRSHDLGNQIQIVKLAALELERRAGDRPELAELLADLRQAAERAAALLADLLAMARPPGRTVAGPAVSHALRAAVELARPALPGAIELSVELDDTASTLASSDELEAMVVAALLDAAAATRITLAARERVIQAKRWVEIVRVDDRQHLADGELEHVFEPPSLLHVVASAARRAGGEVSLGPGRGGLELAIELPVAALVPGVPQA